MPELNEMESTIVGAIKEATIEVFSTMLMLEVKAEEAFNQDEKKISTDLISSLHFFGDKYMGKIAVFASGACSCYLAGAMLGMEAEEVDEDVKDCMGEIGNMVAGGAKTKLEDSMGVLHLLTPWVIAGRNLNIKSPSGGDENNLSIESQAQFSWIMTKFVSDKDYFFVGVQPNDVPQNQTGNPALEKRIKELEDENQKLKEELEKK